MSEKNNEVYSEDMVRSHIKILSDLENSTKSAHKRIDALLVMGDAIQKMAIDFTKLVGTVEQQGKDLTTAVALLTKHDERMDYLEDNMGTGDAITKLQEKISQMEKDSQKRIEEMREENTKKTHEIEVSIEAIKNRDRDEVYGNWKSMKKTILTAAVGLGTSLIFLGVSVVWLIVKNGASL